MYPQYASHLFVIHLIWLWGEKYSSLCKLYDTCRWCWKEEDGRPWLPGWLIFGLVNAMHSRAEDRSCWQIINHIRCSGGWGYWHMAEIIIAITATFHDISFSAIYVNINTVRQLNLYRLCYSNIVVGGLNRRTVQIYEEVWNFACI